MMEYLYVKYSDISPKIVDSYIQVGIQISKSNSLRELALSVNALNDWYSGLEESERNAGKKLRSNLEKLFWFKVYILRNRNEKTEETDNL